MRQMFLALGLTLVGLTASASTQDLSICAASGTDAVRAITKINRQTQNLVNPRINVNEEERHLVYTVYLENSNVAYSVYLLMIEDGKPSSGCLVQNVNMSLIPIMAQ